MCCKDSGGSVEPRHASASIGTPISQSHSNDDWAPADRLQPLIFYRMDVYKGQRWSSAREEPSYTRLLPPLPNSSSPPASRKLGNRTKVTASFTWLESGHLAVLGRSWLEDLCGSQPKYPKNIAVVVSA
ncbi:hypothetical protein ECG_06947 [Echinococcus granulosus]|nr:hypothetical protein ECG_06947 [Echinococcus granulosus]